MGGTGLELVTPSLSIRRSRSRRFADVRSGRMVERNPSRRRIPERTRANAERCHRCHAAPNLFVWCALGRGAEWFRPCWKMGRPAHSNRRPDLAAYEGPSFRTSRVSSLRLRGRPCRVLVVDDDDNAAALAQVLLSSDGRVEMVGRARHGREALTMAASVQPDVILMDLHMPVMGGTDATCRLRQQGSPARIVVVTASEEVDEIRLAREAGADAFVTKPVEANGLVAVILGEEPAASPS